jgi:hypothetical protein
LLSYAGGPPASHVLDVSGAATLSVPVPAGETFSYAGVPGGTYTFTVRAVNITGVSAPSAPLTLTFPSVCSGPPQEPVNFTVSRGGSQLTVSWDPPGTGSAVSSYVLRVTGALNLELPVAGRTISGSVAPGTYNLSVRAYRQPAWDNGASSIPDLDERLHITLAYFAMSLVYAQQEDEILEGVYLARWQRDLSQQLKVILAAPHPRPLVMHGGATIGGVPSFIVIPPTTAP